MPRKHYGESAPQIILQRSQAIGLECHSPELAEGLTIQALQRSQAIGLECHVVSEQPMQITYDLQRSQAIGLE